MFHLGQRLSQHCVTDRLQPSVSEPLIGFKMSSFRPFIPSVNEEKTLVADELLNHFLELLLDIDLECFWSRVDETIASDRLPRSVVPAREHAGVPLVTD